MKRADIEIGKEYACKYDGQVWRCRAEYIGVVHVTVFRMTGTPCPLREIALKAFLMPWPRWLDQQEAKKARTRDIDRQRQEHDALSFVELRARLATYGVAIREWNEELRLVTLRVEDLARLLGR